MRYWIPFQYFQNATKSQRIDMYKSINLPIFTLKLHIVSSDVFILRESIMMNVRKNYTTNIQANVEHTQIS